MVEGAIYGASKENAHDVDIGRTAAVTWTEEYTPVPRGILHIIADSDVQGVAMQAVRPMRARVEKSVCPKPEP